LLTGGAYLSGSGLVLSGLASNYASAPDSAALSITGDIDIQVKVAMTDWTPASEQTVLSKWTTTGNQRSYALNVRSTSGLRLYTTTDGTSTVLTYDSTAATNFSDGATKWIRATLDVNDGLGNRVAKFYTSDDGTNWTQLGTTVTTAGTTSIFDSTAPLEVGSAATGTTTLVVGTIYDASRHRHHQHHQVLLRRSRSLSGRYGNDNFVGSKYRLLHPVHCGRSVDS
jgi:hypothetical protein